MTGIVPPSAEQHPVHREHHGDRTVDEYSWLADAESPAVSAHLVAENDYFDAMTACQAGLREQIADEIAARTVETDLSVPTRKGEWWYYTRTEEGLQYPLYCRCPAGGTGNLPAKSGERAFVGEQVLLDGNKIAAAEGSFALGAFKVSPSGTHLAYSVDSQGDERFTLHVRNLLTGETLPDAIRGAFYTCAWSADDSVLFYAEVDSSWRPHRVRRHVLGTDVADDEVAYEEPDEHFWVTLGVTRSEKFVYLRTASTTSTEIHLLDSATPRAAFRRVRERRAGLYYDVDHRVDPDGTDRLVVLHNDNAPNFALAETSPTDWADWIPLVPHQQDTRILWAMTFARHTMVYFRRDGTTGLSVLSGGKLREIGFPEDVHLVAPAANPEFDAGRFRLTYASAVTPETVYECDMDSGDLTPLRQRPVRARPDGKAFNGNDYAIHREWVTSPDGTRVPVTVVARRDLRRDGGAPMVLYGYGAYERAADVGFSISRLSLLDRGVAYAVAHVRGGGDFGRPWHAAGKLEHKQNTFDDFIACARHLVARGWTSPERLVAKGTSAGGLLVGAAANQEPGLFAGVVARVPFVDPLTTLLDPSLPLTRTEWEELGNPVADPEAYARIKSFSPYENVAHRRYPAVLALASMNDTRVRFHESAKWIARLRAEATGGPFLLHTEFQAGHRGKTGRHEQRRVEAMISAWILSVVRPSTESPASTDAA